MAGSLDDLRSQHPLDWKGVLHSYPIEKVLKSRTLWLSSLCTAVFLGYSAVTQSEYENLISLSNLFIQVVPNLLGFSLGGYALIIGFGNQLVLKKLSRPLSEKNYSLFQLISSIFAVSIIIQAAALVAIAAALLLSHLPTPVSYGPAAVRACNLVGLFFASFLSFYSVLQIPKMVVNVFNFGQLHHFVLRGEDQKGSRRSGKPAKSGQTRPREP